MLYDKESQALSDCATSAPRQFDLQQVAEFPKFSDAAIASRKSNANDASQIVAFYDTLGGRLHYSIPVKHGDAS